MAQGRCADAVYHLEILKKELPDDVDVCDRLGKCQITLGQEERGHRELFRSDPLKPDRVDIYYNKAMALRFPPVENLPEAEKCMAEMIAYWEKSRDQGQGQVGRGAPRLWPVARRNWENTTRP